MFITEYYKRNPTECQMDDTGVYICLAGALGNDKFGERLTLRGRSDILFECNDINRECERNLKGGSCCIRTCRRTKSGVWCEVQFEVFKSN